jgi:hypothetical protein
LGIFWRALEYTIFVSNWNILQPFGKFFPILVQCSKKNLVWK